MLDAECRESQLFGFLELAATGSREGEIENGRIVHGVHPQGGFPSFDGRLPVPRFGRTNALANCDLVIESIVEDLPTKKHLFSELDRIVKDGAILATNTSTLPVIEMAMETGRPELVCGVHFFNPAPMMPLVELVRAITTSDETMTTVRAFAEACGKNPVEVKDQAGFIVNALLFPYLNNAVKLYDAGVATREDIDAAMQGGCNFPMGPLALLDLVGLDTSLSILEALYTEFKDPNYAPAPLLRRMVSAERLGRKSKQGFFDYRK